MRARKASVLNNGDSNRCRLSELGASVVVRSSRRSASALGSAVSLNATTLASWTRAPGSARAGHRSAPSRHSVWPPPEIGPIPQVQATLRFRRTSQMRHARCQQSARRSGLTVLDGVVSALTDPIQTSWFLATCEDRIGPPQDSSTPLRGQPHDCRRRQVSRDRLARRLAILGPSGSSLRPRLPIS